MVLSMGCGGKEMDGPSFAQAAVLSNRRARRASGQVFGTPDAELQRGWVRAERHREPQLHNCNLLSSASGLHHLLHLHVLSPLRAHAWAVVIPATPFPSPSSSLLASDRHADVTTRHAPYQ